MKKKELEIFLEKIPDFPKPKPQYEQYKTPAIIASDILFQALYNEDIQNKKILDLGCGTGIFAIGASVLQAKQVIGIDIDEDCIKLARQFVIENNLDITFEILDVKETDYRVDTVFMNPPFGAQKKNLHADRKFMEKALSQAPIVYSLHLDHTVPFIQKLIKALHADYLIIKTYSFPIKGTFSFHKKLVSTIEVALIRSEKI